MIMMMVLKGSSPSHTRFGSCVQLSTKLGFQDLCQPNHSLVMVFVLIVKGAFNQEKSLVGTFSEQCESLRRFVDSSSPGGWGRAR